MSVFVSSKVIGGLGVMVIIVENGHYEPSSNPGQGFWHFT